MNAVQHSPFAKSAARGGAQRSLRHHRRLQRSEVDGPARFAARQDYTFEKGETKSEKGETKHANQFLARESVNSSPISA